MSRSPLRRIRVLSDGRPGHENQSVGLALALTKRTGASFEVIHLDPAGSIFSRLRSANRSRDDAQLVIAAGHRTHLPLWWAARRLRARSVVIMRPSLPTACFDLALIPRHDLPPGATDTPRRILTCGALNRVPEPEDRPPKEPLGLVLLGGPSKHHGWDETALAPILARILADRPDLRWIIADSRRTPADFLSKLELPPQAQRMPHLQTKPGWLADQLARASVVWVTEDSISMVHEAVTAGAATGILPAPRLRKSRIIRSIDDLVADGLATRYPAAPLPPRAPFHEAARCAQLVLHRLFPAASV